MFVINVDPIRLSDASDSCLCCSASMDKTDNGVYYIPIDCSFGCPDCGEISYAVYRDSEIVASGTDYCYTNVILGSNVKPGDYKVWIKMFDNQGNYLCDRVIYLGEIKEGFLSSIIKDPATARYIIGGIILLAVVYLKYSRGKKYRIIKTSGILSFFY